MMSNAAASFRLLFRANENDAVAGALVIGGVKWRLGDWRDTPGEGEALAYTCVSYAWGDAYGPHPLDPLNAMSVRALSAAEAVIASFSPSALWIDAFCVPLSGPARRECLRRLGAIYRNASQVVAVLSLACAPVLERLAQGDRNLLELDLFESDDWVARAWTYQEILNSQAMHFIAEGGRASLSALDLLNGLGQFMVERERALGVDAFALKALHPRLDALQDLLADWQIGEYLERPVFQVLSGMGGREFKNADDRYDAMIGIVERVPAERTSNEPPVSALEAFLRACEAKGDFSYLYAVSPRSKVAGRSWRPASQGPLRTPIMWHCFGSGQRGSLTSTQLRLEDMALLRQGRVDEKAQEFISEWLGIDAASFDARDAGERAFRRLRDAGFDGASPAIECEPGLVFAQSLHDDAAKLDIVVPLNVRWVHGAPALLLEKGPGGVRRFRDVGVFVGTVADVGEPVDIA